MSPHRLRRYAGTPRYLREQRAARMEQVERCEMCGTPVAARHGHVVDVQRRALMCSCRACFLLFTRHRAHRSRYRAVPDRYLWDPERPVSAAEWDALGLPVDAAFLLRSGTGITVFHPSPAGATERPLDGDVWNGLAAEHPLLTVAERDVEAILFRRTGNGVDCFLVPIDVCYRLVGTVRLHWTGVDGGSHLHEHIDELFAEITDKALAL
ncbi:DUF5947 family protein [Lentzea flava]|uniref:Uncharacterized protein n=1 Tax=Lentzea flava TaxID=103732 RepID=A0ABQ2USZ5_9PSEU|nr:DUF5947 family protein [Lentzea flava]MCP2197290.1 hypothetical protein [Lentzea flava]GGU50171.1 hypothetical protein GCM10010178_48630 [Lentzea flava]